MKKRIMSLLLVMSMIMTMVLPVGAFEKMVTVDCGNSVAVSISGEKTTVTASTASEASEFRWQYLMTMPEMDLELWVNIHGEESETCDLSYAKVGNMLDENEEALLRCVAVVNGEEYYSDEITITVDYTVEELPVPEFVYPEPDDLGEVIIEKIVEEEPVEDDEPAVDEPVVDEPAVDEPAVDEPAVDEPAVDEPAVDEPAVDKPAVDEPAVDEPAVDEPAVDEPAVDEPAVEQPAVEQPAVEQPAVEQPAVEQPAVEQPAVEQPAVVETPVATETTPAAVDSGVMTMSLTHYDQYETYDIVIEYEFENGDVAANPYTANVAAGTPFNDRTVTFPTIKGYLPYIDDVREDSYKFTIDSVTEPVTITVVYKPTLVDYKVIHMRQNIDDDDYTVFHTETLQGLTKSTVPDVAFDTNDKDYYDEGFYALLYEHPEIAADGSTEVVVKYDRNYYLMLFNLVGADAYGVNPVYARYGAEIGDVGTPVRPGYEFKGWLLNGETETVPATMPAENRTYVADWKLEGAAEVKVVFWGENANDEGYSYLNRTETIDVMPGTTIQYNGSNVTTCGYHTHTASCYELICTEDPHNHITDGCSLGNGCTHTAHELSCYSSRNGLSQISEPDYELTPLGNGIYSYYYGSYYCVNIDGQWYQDRYNGRREISFNCDHVHSDSCYSCGKSSHTHSDLTGSCYQLDCDKETHTHTSACYTAIAGENSNLWTFVRSDEVTVAADGSTVMNVYYDRTEKTLTFNYDYDNGYQKQETITAKWGSNIATQYTAIADNAGGTFWSLKHGSGPYTNYFGIMPEENATYYNWGMSGSSGTMTYWGQDLDGNYTVKLFEVPGVGGYSVTVEDRYEFKGFTYHHGTDTGSSCPGATFYYTRNTYTLTFNNGITNEKTETVKYQAPLNTYSSYVPTVPNIYESGTRVFGGWYLNPECTGAEYKLNEHTMPAENVLLYAKWVPISHTVKFYLTKDLMTSDGAMLYDPVTVAHNAKVTPAPAQPTNGKYTFVGWFYLDDNGKEQAFDFANMPVNQDLKVYAKWSSNKLMEYTIYFKYDDGNGNIVDVAAPLEGSGLAGEPRTIAAKGGDELYADYQEGFFPNVKSHTLTLDIEDETKNTYTFWYEPAENVPYTVKYLEEGTEKVLHEEKVVDPNRKAVVTETFEVVPGYMPDKFQKRLVLTVGGENEIIFWYTKDTEHAYYKITHYTENIGGGWSEYTSSQIIGDINTVYTASPISIPGFTYDSSVEGTLISGKLTAEEILELKLYYTRNSYPYQVHYYLQGTTDPLAPSKTSSGLYGQVVAESAISIDGYTAVDPTSKTLAIGVNVDENKLIFYYTEKSVTINYEAVAPEGLADGVEFGLVDRATETVKVNTGTVQGSTATAKDGFRFVGWYNEKGELVSENAKIEPAKVDATYYAKFDYANADLTITKKGAQAIDANQTFVFNVTGPDNFKMTVTVEGNGSVTIKDLPLGTYNVVEDENWSWRYDNTNTTTEVKLVAGGATYEANNTRINDKWLDGNSSSQNIFDPVVVATPAIVNDAIVKKSDEEENA